MVVSLWSWCIQIYRVSQKSSPPQKKTFAIFSLLVNLYNWKLPWLLPNHIPTCVPILVHLSKYLLWPVQSLVHTFVFVVSVLLTADSKSNSVEMKLTLLHVTRIR